MPVWASPVLASTLPNMPWMRAISSSWWQLQAHPPSSEQQPSTWIIHGFKLKQFTDISRPDIIREAYTLQGLARPQLIIEFERYVWDLCPERVAWLHSRLSLYSPAEDTHPKDHPMFGSPGSFIQCQELHVSSVWYGQKYHHSLNSKSGCQLKEVTAESMTESSSQSSSLIFA
jgi:hypothetical protein